MTLNIEKLTLNITNCMAVSERERGSMKTTIVQLGFRLMNSFTPRQKCLRFHKQLYKAFIPWQYRSFPSPTIYFIQPGRKTINMVRGGGNNSKGVEVL